MPGHKDPMGEILFDKEGKAFVIVKNDFVKEEKNIEKKEEKVFLKEDVNKDGKVNFKDAFDVVKRIGRRKK